MTGVLSARRGRHVFPRRYVMVQGKSDPFMKWVRIGILALALIAVLALVIIKRNDIVPGWHTDGDAKYYVTFPLKRLRGSKLSAAATICSRRTAGISCFTAGTSTTGTIIIHFPTER